MDTPTPLDDVRFLREVVDRTLPRYGVNRNWPVTLMYGAIITIGYAVCALLGLTGRTRAIPWVMPFLVFLVAWPLHWVLQRKAQMRTERTGVRPRFRRDLMVLWMSITAMGLFGMAWLIATGMIAGHWYLIPFLWCSLSFVGYVMNGILLSREWFWAGGALLTSMVATGAAGVNYYWLCAVWIPGTLLLAGLMGYRNSGRKNASA